jgi:hypothetical protein
MPKTLVLVAFGLTTLAASAAEAKQYRYIRAHPLSAEAFCYIEVPHVHAVPPFKKVLFRVHDDHYYFVGDPVAYNGDGDRHVYHGHHPIDVRVVIGRDGHEFCYLDGPHYHFFAPPPAARFELKGGVYWYVGKMPRRYQREREIYGSINTIEVRYRRPVVTIEPPPHYVELYVGAPHLSVHAVGHRSHRVPHVRPHVPHVRPVVGVVAPRPHISIGVPAPSVHVEHRVSVGHSHGRGKKKGHKKHKRGR